MIWAVRVSTEYLIRVSTEYLIRMSTEYLMRGNCVNNIVRTEYRNK